MFFGTQCIYRVHGARTVNIVRKMAMDCVHFLFSYIAMLNWLFKLAHFARITCKHVGALSQKFPTRKFKIGT